MRSGEGAPKRRPEISFHKQVDCQGYCMQLLFAKNSNELLSRFAELELLPFSKESDCIAIFRYLNQKFHCERGKQPLIEGKPSKQQAQWLRDMLVKVRQFLEANRTAVVLVSDLGELPV